MPSVYVTHEIAEAGIQLMRKKGFKVDVNRSESDLTTEALRKIFGDYDAVITLLTNKVDASLVDYASKHLKVIANYAVGFDNVDVVAANKRGIIVCNTPGVASESVAEHTFAMILALSKKLREQDKYVREGKYKKWNPNLFVTHQVWGQTIGIIGLGRIGMFVGQMASGGLRMKIVYNDTKRSEDFELLTGAKFSGVEEILKEADIVSLHVPLTEQTRHLIGKSHLKMMKKSAILINTARGPVVDEEALVWALGAGEIAGAGLDVYEHEPEISHEFYKMDNVILTPHTASATVETREQMSKIAGQNIIDVFEGREPYGLVKLVSSK